MESPTAVWRALQALGPLRPSVAAALVRMRDEARAAGLGQRHILSTTGQRLAFARYLRERGRLNDE